MRKQVIFTVLVTALLLGIVSSQTNRIQLSQISKTGATTGQVITYNGSIVVWATPPGAGGGDSITINGTAVTDANFNKTTPVNPAGSFPITYQTSGCKSRKYLEFCRSIRYIRCTTA